MLLQRVFFMIGLLFPKELSVIQTVMLFSFSPVGLFS